VDNGAATAFADTLMILIDQGQDGSLDYAFMWDSKGTPEDQHGLELGVRNVEGTTWDNTRLTDADGNAAKRVTPPDFGSSNGDGYVRLLNGQPTTNFGTTTFVDFAINWTFLTTNSTLGKNQTWDIQLGSISNATDHNDIKYDVSGGLAPTDSRTFPGTVGFSPTAIQLDSLQTTSDASRLPYVVLAGVLFLLLSVRALQQR
jgi:hypothetical protein